jgi:hypothetical protein
VVIEMKTYARIQDGRVAELLTTPLLAGDLYHPSLVWVDASNIPEVAVGWQFDGTRFAPADTPRQELPVTVSLADLQLRVAELGAQIAALVGSA